MEKIVVITGASSGIGRITALHLAQRGMNLVLVSRNADELEELAKECRQHNVKVLVQPADVTDFEAIQHVAEAAQSAFGRVDAWVNNAGITHVGQFMDIDPDEFRRVMDTNFFGVVNGSRAALEIFFEKGQGTIINVSSVLGVVPDPYESPYVASKFAVRGFSGALRQELYAGGHDGIHVCTVIPSSMNTSIYNNAANKSGHEARLIPPVYPAIMVAETIEGLVYRPQGEVYVGEAGRLLAKMYKIAPIVTERLFARYVRKTHFKRSQANNTQGNLFLPSSHIKGDGKQFTLPKYTDNVVAGALIAFGVTLLCKVLKTRKRRD